MKSVMDIEQIAKTIQKLYFYKKIESINFDDIKSSLNTMSGFYKTKNTPLLSNVNRVYDNKFRTINDYNETNIFIYNKNLEKYINTERDVSTILDKNIKKG